MIKRVWWINFEELLEINDFAVYMICNEFKLPNPERDAVDRIEFTKACTKLNDREFQVLFAKLAKVDATLARRAQEDVIETMISLMEEECDKVQEYTVRDFPISTGEKCE